MAATRNRSKYRRNRQEETEGGFFVQLLICAAIICTFMLVKDTPLPTGKTITQYVTGAVNSVVNTQAVSNWIEKFDVVPASGGNIEENKE